MKKIAILGSTGSIGKHALEVARHLSDQIQINALTAHSNLTLLIEQIETFHPEIVCVQHQEQAKLLKERFPSLQVVYGEEGLTEVASSEKVDFVLVAIVGIAALLPTVAAIKAKKEIALANKEVLASAGEFVTGLAKKNDVTLIPIDSEHSAIFQCLMGHKKEEVSRIILTASGGPFRNFSLEQLKEIKLEDALNHPTWKMGPKITIDSSTLMNKGLEMIEAKWLFDFPPEKIDVIIHPQSIIHSFIEWVDGCVVAEMSEPNMCYPIQFAFTYPERKKGMFAPYNFSKNKTFEFIEPDFQKFPSLLLAKEALRQQASFSCYLNAANEVLVNRFLKREIAWHEIVLRLEKLMERHCSYSLFSLEEVQDMDQKAREEALTI